jgi:hypothetical protein
MIWEILAHLVVLAFAGAGLISTLRGRADELLLQMIMALALGGFNVYALGTVWFPTKIVMSWTLLLVLWRILMNRHTKPLSAPWFALWLLLTCWVLVAGLLGFVIDAPLAHDLGSGLRSVEMRPIVQTYTYLSMLALTPLAVMALRTEADLCRFWNTYAITATASCVAALVQWLMLRAGLPFMPILRMTGNASAGAAFTDGNMVVSRLYAFAGEPKALALFLLPISLAAMSTMLQPQPVRPWWGHPVAATAFTLVTILTYSSAALIGLALGTLLLLILMPWLGARLERTLVLALLSVMSVSLLAAASQIFHIQFHIGDLIYFRTVDRLEAGIGERPETAALRYLFVDRPELAPVGFGLGMFIYHIPGLLWGEGTDVIQSGWVTSLVDLGITGTMLVLIFCASAVVSAAQALSTLPASRRGFATAAIAALIAAAAMNLGWGVFMLLTLFVGVLRATTAPDPAMSREAHDPYRQGRTTMKPAGSGS